MDSFRAETLLLRKRAATWILLAIAVIMTLFVGYVLPYSSYLSNADDQPAPGLTEMLPESIVSNLLGAFPFYLGVLAFTLSVLAFGGEYGWGTLKTVLMQRSDRLRLFLAKFAAVGTILALFTLIIFGVAGISSLMIALRENVPVDWPPIADLLQGMAAGYLILTLWSSLGVLLAILSRETALAIGLGILYGLVVEGLISGFGRNIELLQDISQAFLRTNGYSLVASLGATIEEVEGPGTFRGPLVDPSQALLVVILYLAIFGGVSALVLQRRDVT